MNKQIKFYKLGFTLIEMLTVITITVLLITVAIPGWRNFVQNNQAMTLSSRLTSALNLAKSTAIQTGEPTIICPIENPAGATCLNSNQWNAWVIFVDKNTNNVFEPSTDTVIKYFRDQPSGIIRAYTDVGAGTPFNGGITFDASGFRTTAGGDITFTIVPQGCTNQKARSITIMASGNIQVDYMACP